jgi:colanic acid/amylovoran biosynthesis protein
MSIVLDYADLIMPRDNTSKKFLEEFAPQKKFITYPDITLSFKSRVRLRSEAPTKRICIIPNRKMYTQTKLDKETYVTKICQVIDHLCAKGEKPFLLNHEGLKDKYLCRDIQKRCNESIALYNNLGGITTKHMIGQSKVVISSRYHGVASALGQGIPCLATSWSHKYEQLYHDFGVEPNMIDLDSDIFHLQQRIDEFLDVLNLTKTKSDLLTGFIDVQNRNIEMWNKVNKLCQRE